VKTLVSVFLLIILVGPVYSGVGAWTSTNGPNGGNFSSLVFLTTQNNVIFASGGILAGGGPLYRSLNGGSSWRLMKDSTGRPLVGTVREDPLQPGRIALAGADFSASTDMGITWQKIGPPPGAYDFEFNSKDSQIVYVANSGGDNPAFFLKSVDGGKSWSQEVLLSRHQRLAGADLIVSGANPNTLYIQLA
jgi:photosystem II stability/assembly factor-like uncharacterized protein